MSVEPRHAPPLLAQIAALAIVGLVFGTGAWAYIGYQNSINRAFDDQDRRLLADLEADASRIRIVGIGTSLLQRATLGGYELSTLGEDVSRRVHFTRVCRPADRAPGPADLAGKVSGANPQIVVFEKSYLFNRPRKSRMAHRYLNQCRRLVRQAITPNRSVHLPPDPETFLRRWNREWQQRRDIDEDRFAGRQEIWSANMIFGLRPGSRAFLGELQYGGTTVIVIELPPQERILSIHSRRERAEMEAALGRLVGEGMVTHLKCPLEFDDGDFVDPVHLNSDGRERFSRWFFAEMMRLGQPISSESNR